MYQQNTKYLISCVKLRGEGLEWPRGCEKIGQFKEDKMDSKKQDEMDKSYCDICTDKIDKWVLIHFKSGAELYICEQCYIKNKGESFDNTFLDEKPPPIARSISDVNQLVTDYE